MSQLSTGRQHPEATFPIDQRKAERLAMALPVAYTLTLPGKRAHASGRAITTILSGKAMQFITPNKIAARTPCALHLSLPGQRSPLIFSGSVVRCRAIEQRSRKRYEVAVTITHAENERTFHRYCNFVATQLLAKYL